MEKPTKPQSKKNREESVLKSDQRKGWLGPSKWKEGRKRGISQNLSPSKAGGKDMVKEERKAQIRRCIISIKGKGHGERGREEGRKGNGIKKLSKGEVKKGRTETGQRGAIVVSFGEDWAKEQVGGIHVKRSRLGLLPVSTQKKAAQKREDSVRGGATGDGEVCGGSRPCHEYGHREGERKKGEKACSRGRATARPDS